MAVEELSTQDLIKAIVNTGIRLRETANEQLVGAGAIADDARWAGPLPFRWELQVRFLLFGALDAYDVCASVLLQRASQQIFGNIRFLTETLCLVRWLGEPSQQDERQGRAYRLLNSTIARWVKMLDKDAADEEEALSAVGQAKAWGLDLQKQAKEDGISHLGQTPDRPHLFREYFEPIGYSAFAVQSELGSHPGFVGLLLFGTQSQAGQTLDLNAWPEERAFWAGLATMLLGQTCEAVALALGWEEWLRREAVPVIEESVPLLGEALKRRRASRHDNAEREA